MFLATPGNTRTASEILMLIRLIDEARTPAAALYATTALWLLIRNSANRDTLLELTEGDLASAKAAEEAAAAVAEGREVVEEEEAEVAAAAADVDEKVEAAESNGRPSVAAAAAGVGEDGDVGIDG